MREGTFLPLSRISVGDSELEVLLRVKGPLTAQSATHILRVTCCPYPSHIELHQRAHGRRARPWPRSLSSEAGRAVLFQAWAHLQRTLQTLHPAITCQQRSCAAITVHEDEIPAPRFSASEFCIRLLPSTRNHSQRVPRFDRHAPPSPRLSLTQLSRLALPLHHPPNLTTSIKPANKARMSSPKEEEKPHDETRDHADGDNDEVRALLVARAPHHTT